MSGATWSAIPGRTWSSAAAACRQNRAGSLSPGSSDSQATGRRLCRAQSARQSGLAGSGGGAHQGQLLTQAMFQPVREPRAGHEARLPGGHMQLGGQQHVLCGAGRRRSCRYRLRRVRPNHPNIAGAAGGQGAAAAALVIATPRVPNVIFDAATPEKMTIDPPSLMRGARCLASIQRAGHPGVEGSPARVPVQVGDPAASAGGCGGNHVTDRAGPFAEGGDGGFAGQVHGLGADAGLPRVDGVGALAAAGSCHGCSRVTGGEGDRPGEAAAQPDDEHGLVVQGPVMTVSFREATNVASGRAEHGPPSTVAQR